MYIYKEYPPTRVGWVKDPGTYDRFCKSGQFTKCTINSLNNDINHIIVIMQ